MINNLRGRMLFISLFVGLFFGLWMSNAWAGVFMVELLMFVGSCLDYMKDKND